MIKIFHNSKFYLGCCLLRGIIIKYLIRNLKIKGVPLIGTSSRVLTKDGGIISVGKKLTLCDSAELQSRGILKIGSKLSLNNSSRIIAFEKIEIGSNVIIAQFVSILDHDHKFKLLNNELFFSGYNTASIKIGDNVWISDKVTITKGVTIGSNVVIAANSVVTSNIPSNCIAGGIPAKVIKIIQ